MLNAAIQTIQESSNFAEMEVLQALSNTYHKASLILEASDESTDFSSFEVFQEEHSPVIGKKSESMIKRILMFLPRLIMKIIRVLKRIITQIFRAKNRKYIRFALNEMYEASSKNPDDLRDYFKAIGVELGKWYPNPDTNKSGYRFSMQDKKVVIELNLILVNELFHPTEKAELDIMGYGGCLNKDGTFKSYMCNWGFVMRKKIKDLFSSLGWFEAAANFPRENFDKPGVWKGEPVPDRLKKMSAREIKDDAVHWQDELKNSLAKFTYGEHVVSMNDMLVDDSLNTIEKYFSDVCNELENFLNTLKTIDENGVEKYQFPKEFGVPETSKIISAYEANIGTMFAHAMKLSLAGESYHVCCVEIQNMLEKHPIREALRDIKNA